VRGWGVLGCGPDMLLVIEGCYMLEISHQLKNNIKSIYNTIEGSTKCKKFYSTTKSITQNLTKNGKFYPL